jgi:polyferredoxin
MSLSNPSPGGMELSQKAFGIIGMAGLTILVAGSVGNSIISEAEGLVTSLIMMSVGVIGFAYQTYKSQPPGIRNNGIWTSSLTSRGLAGWTAGVAITLFYVLLYWFPSSLGLGSDGNANVGMVAFFDPLSHWLRGQPASQWFVYGTLYTLGILIFGVRFIWKYRHNNYQVLRTISVMFFQLAFAYLIPEFMLKMNLPYNDLKNMWPLNYYFFDEWNVKAFLASGNIGLWMLIFGVLMIFVISPVLTYFYGKRWYCSWVCGCGGLAETVGDPFRQLSDKSMKAWKIERWMIHSVLLFAILMTIGVIYSFIHNNPDGFWLSKGLLVLLIAVILGVYLLVHYLKPSILLDVDKKARKIFAYVGILIIGLISISFLTGNGNAFFIDFYVLRSSYGFLVGAAFSGVIGVGFYPLMGSRVWCRFGCPMAAILGIQQKLFSRFRITTNGGQCISCGNCSTYCEMGIDVRAYAQKGQDIVRASCVGCGICSAVCPRGVLRLENGSADIFEKAAETRTNVFQD